MGNACVTRVSAGGHRSVFNRMIRAMHWCADEILQLTPLYFSGGEYMNSSLDVYALKDDRVATTSTVQLHNVACRQRKHIEER